MSSLKNNLSGADTGKNYWRSLNEVSGSPEFSEYLTREFPEGADEFGGSDSSRRDFMKIMAAGFAVAGAATLTGCRRPEEKILPYGTNAPEDIIPGKATYYATSYPRPNGSIGLLVKTHEGRPVKIEGNPEHPNNLGSTDSFAQAELLNMYDPDRLQFPVFSNDDFKAGQIDYMSGEQHAIDERVEKKDALAAKNRKAFDAQLTALAASLAADKGAGTSILLPPTSSPSEIALIADIKKKYPAVKFHTYAPINDDNAAKALKTFVKNGAKSYQTVNNFDKANTILALDSDFMLGETDALRNAKGFSEGRKVSHEKGADHGTYEMNRLYVVESIFSLTGSNADHRLRLKSSQVEELLFLVAQKVLANAKISQALKNVVSPILSTYKGGVLKQDDVFSQQKDEHGEYKKFTVADYISAVADDLIADAANPTKNSLIVVGEKQDSNVHLLALVLNSVLGNLGKTVSITEKVNYTEGLQTDSITSLSLDLNSKTTTVKNLVILGGNPAFDAPADLKIGELIAKATNSIHLTTYYNETSALVKAAAPQAHFLEAWGDTRSYDGTLTFQQPMIAPLYNGLSNLEFLAKLSGDAKANGMKIVKATHGYPESIWNDLLYKGFKAGSAFTTQAVTVNWDSVKSAFNGSKAKATSAFEIVITPDNSLYDGSFANNGWLQELPDPITKLTWDNAALMSVKTATELGATTANDLNNKPTDEKVIVAVTVNGAQVELPVAVAPGMADGVIHLQLGYGRKVVGYVGKEAGSDVFPLRSTTNLHIASGDVKKTTKTMLIASTQDHWAMEGRDLIKSGTLDTFNSNNDFADMKYEARPKSLFDDRAAFKEENQVKTGDQWTANNQWAMVIDLNQCNGCSACTIACQSENNIPTVGKERVLQGREMHWIRMDRYFYSNSVISNPLETSDYENYDTEVEIAHQGVPCMQCENAPCEQVCPVAATVHTEEGLNDMVYNRCIGTRYCLNNCPFKVRRFNYFNFQEDFKNPKFEVKKMVHNPNVTVRSRGVMEKCTYCVQRINEAKIDAKVKNDGILERDNFTTACAQVCPTGAITFGNQNDEGSAVSAKQKDSRNYMMLPEYNVRPRTTFLAKLSNKNIKLTVPAVTGGH